MNLTNKNLVIISLGLTISLLVFLYLNFMPIGSEKTNRSDTGIKQLPQSSSPYTDSQSLDSVPDYYVQEDDEIYTGSGLNPKLSKVVSNEEFYFAHAGGKYFQSRNQIDQTVLHDYSGRIIESKPVAEQQYWSNNGEYRVLDVTDYNSPPDKNGQIPAAYRLQTVKDIKSVTPIQLEIPYKTITSVLNDGRIMLVSAKNGTDKTEIKILSQNLQKTENFTINKMVLKTRISPDNKALLVLTKNTLDIVDITSKQVKTVMENIDSGGASLKNFQWSTDGKYIAIEIESYERSNNKVGFIALQDNKIKYIDTKAIDAVINNIKEKDLTDYYKLEFEGWTSDSNGMYLRANRSFLGSHLQSGEGSYFLYNLSTFNLQEIPQLRNKVVHFSYIWY